jgi:hypothetical protein
VSGLSLSLTGCCCSSSSLFSFFFLSTFFSDETGKVQSSAHFLTTFQTTFTSVSPWADGGVEAFRFFGVFIYFSKGEEEEEDILAGCELM